MALVQPPQGWGESKKGSLDCQILSDSWSLLGCDAQRCYEEEYLPRSMAAYEALVAGECAGSDFLGWLDLPARMAGGALEAIEAQAAAWALQYEAVVVVGIGGSYLGARAVQEALGYTLSCDKERTKVAVYYLGYTLCGATYAHVLRAVEGKRWGVVVISKSGTTLESAVTFRLLREAMEREPAGACAERIAVVTDGASGALYTLAQQEGYVRFVLPDDVGGRYSVFSAVGLFPLALAGVDVRAFIDGACRGARLFLHDGGGTTNVAVRYASLRQFLQERGYWVELLAYYTPLLHYVGEWFKQLFAESEGKAGGGILPMTLCYSTDLHSLGQYVQEGRRILFETHLEVGCSPVLEGEVIRKDVANIDGLNYLEGKDLFSITTAIQQAAQQAHVAGGVPSVRLQLGALDAYHVGLLLYFFELSCALSGLVQGVNPFDQPGVEAYKRSMFALLGRP